MRSNFVSLHPDLKVHPGNLDTVRTLLMRFVEKTVNERGIFSTGSVSTAMKFSAAKVTKAPKALLRISTMSAHCFRKCSIWRSHPRGVAWSRRGTGKIKRPARASQSSVVCAGGGQEVKITKSKAKKRHVYFGAREATIFSKRGSSRSRLQSRCNIRRA